MKCKKIVVQNSDRLIGMYIDDNGHSLVIGLFEALNFSIPNSLELIWFSQLDAFDGGVCWLRTYHMYQSGAHLMKFDYSCEAKSVLVFRGHFEFHLTHVSNFSFTTRSIVLSTQSIRFILYSSDEISALVHSLVVHTFI